MTINVPLTRKIFSFLFAAGMTYVSFNALVLRFWFSNEPVAQIMAWPFGLIQPIMAIWYYRMAHVWTGGEVTPLDNGYGRPKAIMGYFDHAALGIPAFALMAGGFLGLQYLWDEPRIALLNWSADHGVAWVGYVGVILGVFTSTGLLMALAYWVFPKSAKAVWQMFD